MIKPKKARDLHYVWMLNRVIQCPSREKATDLARTADPDADCERAVVQKRCPEATGRRPDAGRLTSGSDRNGSAGEPMLAEKANQARPHSSGFSSEEINRIQRINSNKLLVDRTIAIILLVALSPLLLLVWLAVKLTSRGPGFYSQIRLGLDGKPFQIFKFRTMSHNCEKVSGPVWATKNDSRITWFGKFLRVSHLDELPQLLNVLRGEMALVGPRPERPEIVTSKILPRLPNYMDRLMVRPGVTGLAQICAPADQSIEDTRRKLRFDLEYMQRMSFSLDMRICLLTFLKVIGFNRHFVRRLFLVERPNLLGTPTRGDSASEVPQFAG